MIQNFFLSQSEIVLEPELNYLILFLSMILSSFSLIHTSYHVIIKLPLC